MEGLVKEGAAFCLQLLPVRSGLHRGTVLFIAVSHCGGDAQPRTPGGHRCSASQHSPACPGGAALQLREREANR